ncbi:MAG: hypothetical protein GXP24_00745 [Planctomycetes bacterium]|nr:hypothetical protein [Planctomycetota bacterium]
MIRCVVLCVVLIVVTLVSGATFLQAAPPQLARVSPLAVAPGKTVDFALHGKHLLQPQRMWTTFAARTEFAVAEDESSKKGEKLFCHVTVPRDEQVGICAVRVVTMGGVSNPILLMVDDLRSVSEATDNHSLDKAQLLDLPLAVDGQCDSVKVDMFRFFVSAGQRLSFEVVAQRIGSQLDSVLRLMTADGKEIVRVDDTQGTGGDSRFSHTFETEGEYLISIEDIRHLGGTGFHYRLRIGEFPLITAVYPAGGKCGEISSFQLLSSTTDQLTPLHVALPKVFGSSLVSFGVKNNPRGGTGWFQVESNPGSQSLEQEPNDELQEATEVVFPGVINGRLEKPGDRDHFRFQATKGQRLHCVARTRELGSPCDLYLSLHKTDGSRIALAPQARRTVLNILIPADGEYVLRVEDLLSGGSPEHIYRLDMKDAFSGFELHAEKNEYVAPQGGTVVVKVLAKRTGFTGPLELAVEGLGPGVSLENKKLEGAETLLKITLPTELPQGVMRLVKIIGKAKEGDHFFTVAANQREPLRVLFPSTNSLPTPLVETIALGVGPPFASYFELAVPGNKAYFPQLVGTSTFDIEIKRINEAFKAEVALVVNGLPEGVTAEIAPVEKGLKAYRVTLKGPPEIGVGSFPISIVGTGKFQEQTKVVPLENVTLQITKPLVVQLTLPGPLVAGSSQEAVITLHRFGAEPQPVRVHVSDGPAGLSAPIFVTIPSDANQAKIRLAAAADALPGKFENLTVVASTTVQGQNIVVQSEPVSGEIQTPPPAETPAETPAKTPDKPPTEESPSE